MKKLSVATGSYIDKQTNEQKTEWTKLGVMGTSQNGKEYIMLDPKVNLAALPIGENGMIMVTVYDDAQQQGGSNQPNQQYQKPQPEYQNSNGQQVSRDQYQQQQQNYNARYFR